jgi:hypothetical protein
MIQKLGTQLNLRLNNFDARLDSEVTTIRKEVNQNWEHFKLATKVINKNFDSVNHTFGRFEGLIQENFDEMEEKADDASKKYKEDILELRQILIVGLLFGNVAGSCRFFF